MTGDVAVWSAYTFDAWLTVLGSALALGALVGALVAVFNSWGPS